MEYFVTGVMSGTSLDGMDIAYCSFKKTANKWQYRILASETFPYSNEWQESLMNAARLDGRRLIELHYSYGHFVGETLNDFFRKHNIDQPTAIASHGHTIFHRPDKGYTFQLGSGAAIAAKVGSKVICDFRSLDVSLNGQGAPLVPIGDKLLFPEYDYCINLGGFANTSYDKNGRRQAYDVCPLNFVINRIVQKENIPNTEPFTAQAEKHAGSLQFDPKGSLAEKGHVNPELLQLLNELSYYKKTGAKSLGAEWVDKYIWPLIQNSGLAFHDKLRTFYEHAALQISQSLSDPNKKSALLSGGGCYNDFLINLVRTKAPDRMAIILADPKIIEFKEALVFAFLGVLFLRGEDNCLSAVTGSLTDNIGGSLYQGTRSMT